MVMSTPNPDEFISAGVHDRPHRSDDPPKVLTVSTNGHSMRVALLTRPGDPPLSINTPSSITPGVNPDVSWMVKSICIPSIVASSGTDNPKLLTLRISHVDSGSRVNVAFV